MAVVVVMDQKGDKTELLKKYDIVSEHMMADGTPPKGLLAHFCMKTSDGIRVSNVWESEEAAKAGLEDPRLKEGFAKAEMPKVEPQFLPVHNHFITSEIPARV